VTNDSRGLIGTVIADRYEVQRELGRGAMGIVYLARDPRHDRDVALKILDPSIASGIGAERFLREIRLAAKLSHPHIVPVYDSGECRGILFYVMPAIAGLTLRQRLERDKKIPVAEAVRIARDVASALDYAHGVGIVHRDVKPDNVMFHQNEAVVTDFGIAKALSASRSGQLTSTGISIGTPAYMSPEQAAGASDIDARSDQYSLACMLYEMIAGEPPFTAQSAQAVIARRFYETPKPLRSVVGDVPARISNALSRALATEASDRFGSTGQFSDALAEGQHTTPGVGAVERRSIAVIPFANLSPEPDSEYFADGVAEEIINALTRVRALDVVSRTSSFAFKGRNEDIREIGRKLDVGTVLEGTVRKAGQRLRLNADLIDVESGYHLWSERYDRELADVFAIQDEIAESIVSALRVVLSPTESKAVKATPVNDIRAYEFYLRGRQLQHQHRKAGHLQAIEWFERAIEIDPAYALAYTGIADSASLLYLYREATRENLERAESASLRALELNPNLAEAHAARGLALSLSRKWDEATAEFERALEIDPRNYEAAYFHARASQAHGAFEVAAEMFERAAASRPDDYQALAMLDLALRRLGRNDEAREASRRAMAAIDRRLAIDPGEARAWYLGAGMLMNIGERDRAFEYAERALAVDPDEVSTLYNVGCLYAQAGDKDRAIENFARAVQHGFASPEWIDSDPDWDSVRGDPRFQEVRRRMDKKR
jgi:serine/threonine protein kinase/regulator of sirC expression with transglutaminase-like and TPR domain